MEQWVSKCLHCQKYNIYWCLHAYAELCTRTATTPEPHKSTGMHKRTERRHNPTHRPLLSPTTTTTTPTDCQQWLQCSLNTSRAPWLSPSRQLAAYRQMHKEFNRVDLMRERKRNQGARQCYGSAGQSGAADRSDQTTSTGQSSVSASSSQYCGLQQQQQPGQAGGRLQLRGRRRDHTLGDKLNFFFFIQQKLARAQLRDLH